MKTRLLSLSLGLLVSLSCCALAADPVVAITPADTVTVDGTAFGKPADTIANNPSLAPAIQRALDAHLATLRAERDAAKAELATLTAFAQQLVERAATALQAGDTAALQTILASARAPKVAREKEALAKEQAEAEAKLAEIAAKQAALQ